MSAADTQNFGFIGLGLMGKPMALNLAKSFAEVQHLYVYDLEQSATTEVYDALPERVTICTSPRDVATKTDLIMTMLPAGRHVEEVYIKSTLSICSADLSGKTLIDCSTIDSATSSLVKNYLVNQYPTASFYDAPVSGGVRGAIDASIAFFLGCSESDTNLPRLRATLGSMGNEIIACGGPGLGIASKLSNNYLSGTITIACSEAFDMGMRAGVSPKVLYRVFGAGTAQNTICDKFCPVPDIVLDAPSSKGYKGGFKLQLMHKDYALAMAMADEYGSRPVLGSAGIQAWREANEDADLRGLDSRVIYQYVCRRGKP